MTAIIIGERVKIIQFYHISKRHIFFKGYLILSIQLVMFEGAMICSNLINHIVSALNL